MKRDAWKLLEQWKDKKGRKPLLVIGARQVGKTYLIRKFAEANFTNTVYINCDKDSRLVPLFEQDYDVNRILNGLRILSKQTIVAGETCIIIDEIQEVPRALGSLKYFCEDAPQYHIIVAGSLMGIVLHRGTSFPVGKVDTLKLFPMNFGEFLQAKGEDDLRQLLCTKDWDLIKVMKSQYISLLREYYFVGGMPEAVFSYCTSGNINEVRDIQNNILLSYDNDISKHAPSNEAVKIRSVWNSIPSQLSKDNKKFVYGLLKGGARAKEYETAIEWLIDYGVVYKILRITKPIVPLKMYEDNSAFRLFVLDCGLFGAMSTTPPDQMLIGDNVFGEYKGAFTEQYVLEQLKTIKDMPVYYWSNTSSSAELDFIVQKGSTIIPIEVKAEENLKAKSLKTYVDSNKGLRGLRLSMSDFRMQEWMDNVPLYAALQWLDDTYR
jgi:predicted AAA+ superfamily ATPase